jgi:transposase
MGMTPDILDPNGGTDEVSRHRRPLGRKRVVPARRGRGPGAHGHHEDLGAGAAQLAAELGKAGDLVAGQEVGTQVYLVHDALSSAGVPVLSFNAAHLRVIAASRKKTDRRDAYWIAKSLQTGMTPHPVYVPGGEVRELRQLLSRRTMIKRDLKRWQVRARALLRAHGHRLRPGGHHINRLVTALLERPEGLATSVVESLGMCERFIDMLCEEVAHVDALLAVRTEATRWSPA